MSTFSFASEASVIKSDYKPRLKNWLRIFAAAYIRVNKTLRVKNAAYDRESTVIVTRFARYKKKFVLFIGKTIKGGPKMPLGLKVCAFFWSEEKILLAKSLMNNQTNAGIFTAINFVKFSGQQQKECVKKESSATPKKVGIILTSISLMMSENRRCESNHLLRR